MDTRNFYYSHLNVAQKEFYRALEERVRFYQSYPFTVTVNATPEEAIEAYRALYLDKCYIQMPPTHLAIFSRAWPHGVTITFDQAVRPASKDEVARCEAIIQDLISENPPEADSQHRAFLTVITRRLFERAVYQITRNGFGESPRDILLYHSGYCTGFARTVKAICDRARIPCVCVTGTLKKHCSAFLNPDDPNADIAHMWNAIHDGKRWIFLDPTSCISFATRKISAELSEGYHRDFYGNGAFCRLEFLELSALLKKYTLEEESLFC